MYCYFIIIGLLIFEGESFVFMKVPKKNDTQSNMASLIRKLGNRIDSKKVGRRTGDTTDGSKENSLESVVLAIDTGVKKFMAGKTRPDIVDSIAKSIVDFAKNSADPIYRSKTQYDIKPEIIHFRSDKPSVMFELNSKSIINVLKDLLQSKTVHKYMDTFTKEAAVIYRTLKHELDKAQTKENIKQ